MQELKLSTQLLEKPILVEKIDQQAPQADPVSAVCNTFATSTFEMLSSTCYTIELICHLIICHKWKF